MKAQVVNIIHKVGSFTKKDTGELIAYDNFEVHALRHTDDGTFCVIGTTKNVPANYAELIGEICTLDVIAKDGGRYKFESVEEI